MSINQQLGIYIRWMSRRDMPEVLAIENASFEHPWSEEEWIRCLRQRTNIGMVVERDEVVIGHMVYALEPKTINVLNMAVRPDLVRMGIGRAMIDKLKSKLHLQRRNKIICNVQEYNLEAQLFMRSCGFTAVETTRGFFVNPCTFEPVDAIRFVHLCNWIELEDEPYQC